MEDEATKTRLFVGGLGDKVTEDDIKNTFSKLGVVHSVDIIRTKGRSFAYINFFPSSPNSLPKLFSTYNGCAWKGGKLKLEKAKEHYTDRLKREWAEEAELKNGEHISHGEVDASIADSSEPQNSLDLKNMEIRVFFPKLRKVKPLPLSGTGKHKYSFRRLEAPPNPVHFCDCPEHSVLVETRTVTRANDSRIRKGGINKKENNMMNSVMNRFVSREKNHMEDKIHDSVIQDSGMNDDEISMMDSVMKKLLDKGALKNNGKNVHNSLEKTVLTSEIQEETVRTDDIDDGTDDDDIQINAVARQSFSFFPSRSLERQKSLPHEETNDVDDETNDIDDETEDDDDDDDIQINAVGGRNKRQTSLANEMARLNERRNRDDLAHQTKPGFLDQNVESLKRRRNSVIDANSDDLAYSVHPKIQVKKSEENTTVNIQPEPEPEPKRLKTNGMWSQKSAWKQLVGDGSSSSFTLSQITPGKGANHEKKPKLRKKAPLGVKKGKKTVRFALETPIDSMEHEQVDKFEETDDKSSQHGTKGKKVPQVEPEELKLSDETPIGKEEDEVVNNSVQIGQSTQHDEKNEPSVAVAQTPRGSSWLQRSSWTQLVGGSNNNSFSISQILPTDLLQRQKSEKPDEFGSFSTISTGSFFKEPRTSETGSDGSGGSKSGLDATEKYVQGASAPRDIEMSEASDMEPKKTTSVLRRGVEISESCPFMRNADSVKDWMTAKTAMSNSLKKMKNK
ncbi:hypothetical protein RND81_08G191800 [Saponaria officinalis]|uniref:RRM domain-containing protein n=1 Tax=Saponaria officinalis TaxID=3572 RepID=A0AAW1J9Q2_SAPOF